MPLKLPRVRARTLASGAGLGGALLLGLALVGGVGDAPSPFEERAPDRRGPVTAIQPQLREALLTDQDLPPAPPPSTPPVEPAAPAAAAPIPPTRLPDPETGAIAELCRALFGEACEPNREGCEDPAALAGLWPTPPKETTSRYTEQRGGATLHQLLGVFDGGRSLEAYRRLRESATGCDRFDATLPDGAPVTVLLRELTADRRESATADDSFTMLVTLEDGTMAGWLTVDRVGPVVSVLRHLGPTDDRDDIAQTRHAALDKLQPLLRTLHQLRD
jgi:hypothetical protein